MSFPVCIISTVFFGLVLASIELGWPECQTDRDNAMAPCPPNIPHFSLSLSLGVIGALVRLWDLEDLKPLLCLLLSPALILSFLQTVLHA
ncbi:hypothetical protein F5H01DRAFT_356607 [Linnemannia elongata]|nr:hypothetical protein F5H01DRAFT_356607 [Linnemannia elongata]